MTERRRERDQLVAVHDQAGPEGEVAREHDGDHERNGRAASASSDVRRAGRLPVPAARVDALFDDVAAEVAGDRMRPTCTHRLEVRRDHEVQDVAGVVLRGREPGEPDVCERVVEERRCEQRREDIGTGQRGEQPDEALPPLGHEEQRQRKRQHERDGRRERDLGREVDLERDQRPEADDQGARPELALERAHDHECDQGDCEDRGQVRLPQHVPELVAREAEEVAADRGRPETADEMPAEQVRSPCRERRHQHRGHVVGGNRTDRCRERRKDDRKCRRRRRPGQVHAARRPEHMLDERILEVLERVEPPAERPDEDLRIVGQADVLVPGLDQDPEPEEREGERAEPAEHPEVRPPAAPLGLARRD